MWCPNVVSLSDHTVVHKIAICYLQMLRACLKIWVAAAGIWTSSGRVRSGAGSARGLMGSPQPLLEVSTTWERNDSPEKSTHRYTHLWRRCVWAASMAGQIAARLFHYEAVASLLLLLNFTNTTLFVFSVILGFFFIPECVFHQHTCAGAVAMAGCFSRRHFTRWWFTCFAWWLSVISALPLRSRVLSF